MSSIDPGDAAAPLSQLSLSGQRLSLLGALDRLSPELGKMYRGGLQVLADRSNPDRLPQSAQSLRELMEKLPVFLNIPFTAHPGELAQRVTELQKSYVALCKVRGLAPSDWNGEIDQGIRDFMCGMAGFVEWRNQQPNRRAEARGTIEKLEVSGRQLPARLVERDTDMWHKCRAYFADVAHHRGSIVEREFEATLDKVERFLTDRFAPRTFEDFDEIDKLLHEDTNAKG